MDAESQVRAVEGSCADVVLDEGRQALARERARYHRWLMAAELLLSALLVVGFGLSGASRGLKDALVGLGLVSPWSLVPAYVSVVVVGYAFLLAPLAWWGGYVLPHRYGLSTQTLRGWLADQLKSLALLLLLGLPAAEVVYWLLRVRPGTWWLWAGAFLILCGVLLSHLAPVLLLPLFYRLSPLDDPDLVERIGRLAERAGRRVVGVYTINMSARTTAANAVVMGLGRTRRIALGDTLYADYSPDEIEAIVAHELGHQVHRDLEWGVGVQSVLMLGGLYLAHLFLRWGVARFGLEGVDDVVAMPLFALAAGGFSVATLPLLNAYSRWRERQADRYAARVSEGSALARAFIRLANQNLAEADPPRWAVWLLYSHPPIGERVRDVQ